MILEIILGVIAVGYAGYEVGHYFGKKIGFSAGSIVCDDCAQDLIEHGYAMGRADARTEQRLADELQAKNAPVLKGTTKAVVNKKKK